MPITVIPNTMMFGETAPAGWDATNSGSNLTLFGQTVTNNSGNSIAETAIVTGLPNTVSFSHNGFIPWEVIDR